MKKKTVEKTKETVSKEELEASAWEQDRLAKIKPWIKNDHYPDILRYSLQGEKVPPSLLLWRTGTKYLINHE